MERRETSANWVARGGLWSVVILAVVIGFDRVACMAMDAAEWDANCAHRLLSQDLPIFEVAMVALVVPMALWRAHRRARGLDQPWDWLDWLPGSFGPGPG